MRKKPVIIESHGNRPPVSVMQSVVRKTNGYYVIAAQSLSETEKHIDHIGLLVLLAWLAYSIMSMGAFLLLHQWF